MQKVKPYRKIPVVINAIQFTDDEYETLTSIQDFMYGRETLRVSYEDPNNRPRLVIETLEGDLYADLNDFIIEGVDGEFYPCKPDIFEKTYEEV